MGIRIISLGLGILVFIQISLVSGYLLGSSYFLSLAKIPFSSHFHLDHNEDTISSETLVSLGSNNRKTNQKYFNCLRQHGIDDSIDSQSKVCIPSKILTPLILAITLVFTGYSDSSSGNAMTIEHNPSTAMYASSIITGSSANNLDQAKEEFLEISRLQDQAFEYTNNLQFTDAERIWSIIISKNTKNAAAFSNRGNCRVSMGKCKEGMEDFNSAIALANDEPDPYLGRGVAYECQGKYEEAIQDYVTANEKNIAISSKHIEDPVTYNNRANAEMKLNRYQEALDHYRKAYTLQPDYVFPKAGEALALYEMKEDSLATKKIRLLLLKYPEFADMHAALACLYWEQGDNAKAIKEWNIATQQDYRYTRREWITNIRKWPPRIVQTYDNFLSTLR